MCEIGRFELFFDREINNVHKFLCTCNAVCVHATYTVVNEDAICEGLGSKRDTRERLIYTKLIIVFTIII